MDNLVGVAFAAKLINRDIIDFARIFREFNLTKVCAYQPSDLSAFGQGKAVLGAVETSLSQEVLFHRLVAR